MHRPLNLKRFRKHDVVCHYRSGRLFVVLSGRWRSECLDLWDVESLEKVILHPRFLDPCENGMLVLAALHTL
jgi:hypothetical protein